MSHSENTFKTEKKCSLSRNHSTGGHPRGLQWCVCVCARVRLDLVIIIVITEPIIDHSTFLLRPGSRKTYCAALQPIITKILFYDCHKPMQAYLSRCYGQ